MKYDAYYMHGAKCLEIVRGLKNNLEDFTAKSIVAFSHHVDVKEITVIFKEREPNKHPFENVNIVVLEG